MDEWPLYALSVAYIACTLLRVDSCTCLKSALLKDDNLIN